MLDQSEEEKGYWKSATERRRLNGIRLGKLSFMVEKEQVSGFLELYQTWIQRWGKTDATDALIAAMCEYEAKFQDLKEMVRKRKEEKKRGKHSKKF